MMKWLPWLVVVLSLAGAFWEHQRQAEARERAAEMEEVADSLLAVIDDRDVRIDSLEVEVDSAYAIADSVREWAETIVVVARGRQEEAERRLREHLTPEQEADLDELLAAHRLEVAAMQAHIDALIEVTVQQDRLIVTQRNQLADYSEAVERLEELVAFWEGEANPPFWTAVWEDAPTIAISGAIGLGLGVALSQ